MWWIKSLVLSNEIFHAGILIRALPSLTPLWKTKQQQEQQCPIYSWNETVLVTLSNLWQFCAVFSFHSILAWALCGMQFFSLSFLVLLHGTLINPIFSADKIYVEGITTLKTLPQLPDAPYKPHREYECARTPDNILSQGWLTYLFPGKWGLFT